MRKMKTLPLPRFVEPASIDEGDTIRVVWKVGDVEHSRTGKVGRIIHDNCYRTFVSPDGNEIVRFGRNTRLRFTLLAEAPPKKQETSFEMESA